MAYKSWDDPPRLSPPICVGLLRFPGEKKNMHPFLGSRLRLTAYKAEEVQRSELPGACGFAPCWMGWWFLRRLGWCGYLVWPNRGRGVTCWWLVFSRYLFMLVLRFVWGFCFCWGVSVVVVSFSYKILLAIFWSSVVDCLLGSSG